MEDVTGWGMLANLGAGLIQKHLFKKLPNNFIPWINLGLSTGVGYAMTGDIRLGIQFGVGAAMGATGLHQLAKTALSKTKAMNI